ncbi:MAG: TrkH family potassium uptake protein [Deltaproteobacteria bacterium]|nr:TrkH family potassium uptake protein [Deltaproteobacteria bacterium]MBW1952451.1 TrkH family potassium uptake protein [Deltaproteobacteria bacterium]MBW1987775.1 TrkH family potassium uptake protein [Deltaproteobacteria bacterium]MBW2134902.1 TrkH family potassium uptake protein [Deltaproteobacteria bacterium]
MRWRYILHIIGALIVCIGLCMLFPLGFSLYYWDTGLVPLLHSMAITVVIGVSLYISFKNDNSKGFLSHREGMVITALGWLAAGSFGALPFLLSGVFSSPVDCFFESFSGFTTTGASVLTDIESVPKGLLFWRSLTHWLGGMGIIVLSLAILPFLGVGGMQLYKAEVPGPVPDKLTPRIKDTAMLLWQVYLLFSLIEAVLLVFGGMSLFDALCHTFGTMATGGFSTKNASIAYYDSAYIQTVITIFMLIAGINFSLHFQLLRGKPLVMWRDAECRFFLGLFLIFGIVTTISVYQDNYPSLGQAVQYASFQVASILTTTGYVTADFELWPSLPQCILLLCMFIGGSAGSTGGGMKCMRIMLLLKHSYQEIIRIIHPRAVIRVKLGKRVVPTDVLSGIWGFFILWLGLLFLSTLLVAASGVDVVTSFASVLACIGNIGPGIGAVGPTDNYAMIPAFAKWVLMLCMLLGRLEIFTVIILFIPEFYRK